MNTEDLRDARDNDQEVNEFNLLEFSLQLLQNWYWIAISVAITLCIAVFCMLRTTPTYTRSTSILIKNEDGKPSGSGVVSLSQDFQNLSGMLGTNTNIKNEMYTIGAPVVMQEVAKRLHLDVKWRWNKDCTMCLCMKNHQSNYCCRRLMTTICSPSKCACTPTRLPNFGTLKMGG